MNVTARRTGKFPLRLDQMTPRGRAPNARSTGPLGGPSASAMPVGVGMDSEQFVLRMVQRLRDRGVTHHRVLEAMAAIRRHEFLDSALAVQAYQDTSLPIGHGQTISKPSVVARMIELLFDGTTARRSQSLGRVLEIGTGCGYQAAVLAHLSSSVVSIERIRLLHERARELLVDVRRDSVRLVFGDGMRGHLPNAPYDSIIAAAGGDSVPQAWIDQLAPGGRLVAPARHLGANEQVLVIVDRSDEGIRQTVFEAVNFVPLKSGVVG